MSKGYGKPMVVDVVIPALNEEGAVAQVVRGLIRTNLVRDVWVVDNGSTDATARCAEEAGARVISESRKGYGQACQKGLANLRPGCEVVAFIDADGSDGPAELVRVLEPIFQDRADLSWARGLWARRSQAPSRRSKWWATPLRRAGYVFALVSRQRIWDRFERSVKTGSMPWAWSIPITGGPLKCR